MKVLLVASAGGHLAQALALMASLTDYDVTLVTESTDVTRAMNVPCPVYYLCLNYRKHPLFLWKMLINTIRSVRILWRERPQVIISTGANATIPMSILGKIMGSRLIFVESFAKVKSPTRTGRLMYRWADLFIVQWPDLLEYYPRAKWGAIY